MGSADSNSISIVAPKREGIGGIIGLLRIGSRLPRMSHTTETREVGRRPRRAWRIEEDKDSFGD